MHVFVGYPNKVGGYFLLANSMCTVSNNKVKLNEWNISWDIDTLCQIVVWIFRRLKEKHKFSNTKKKNHEKGRYLDVEANNSNEYKVSAATVATAKTIGICALQGLGIYSNNYMIVSLFPSCHRFSIQFFFGAWRRFFVLHIFKIQSKRFSYGIHVI